MTPPRGVKASFLPRLAGFCSFLRLRGLAIGIGAELDLAEALGRISLLDREAFREACKITLAKAPDDVTRIEEAFEVYWTSYIPEAESETPLAVAAPSSPPPDGVVAEAPVPIAMRLTVDREGVVRVGMYSPDAPPLGHLLTPQGRNRLLAIRSGARRFRRHAATLPGRRFEAYRRGAIDFPATARHSLRQGGEWVEFRFQHRKRRRAELVVLWDVSGSMRDHDSDLFALVYALQRAVRRTRTFAFSTNLQEVTQDLRGRTYARAAEAVTRSLFPASGGTRIGPCLDDFLRRFGAHLHPWTTLVILSDGWDQGDTVRLGRALERFRRRCHLLVWVNPYADQPEFEPSTAGMQEALPHVDLLLGPADFVVSRSFAPERVVARRRAARAHSLDKAFIADTR